MSFMRKLTVMGRGIYRNARRFFKVFFLSTTKSCFPKKKFVTSIYNKEIVKINNKINLINKLEKMRYKEVVLNKLERLEAEIKNVGYHIHKNNRDEAYAKVAELLEATGDIRTLLNSEQQD